MSKPLDGRVVAITGGARGIGHTTARRLVALGASVAIGDIDDDALEAAAAELGTSAHHRVDVTDPASFAAFLDHVEATVGPLDVLINNAGIMPVGRIVDEDDAVTKRILDIDVFGVIIGTKLALQRMLPRGRGHVVNIASLAGELPMPGLSTYCGAKHAVLGFSDAVRKEVRGTGVHVSSVLPNLTNTQLASGTTGMRGFRQVQPEEVADAIAGLLTRPRPRVRLTRVAGLLVQAQGFVPGPLWEAVSRLFGVESQFISGYDTAARAAYEDRVRAC
ncbi:SDR family oxidoreductase [Speluncibacter jeojiensis]|uniref:SDR family oxidoreductase n=1 Tax=Speluncibacter jeojiensis TaxID=2710754 RepID=A0A9X4LZU0_9ACTN|nr:SDR family oxidoreductase [Corynebacteriales bacterium D3-21]